MCSNEEGGGEDADTLRDNVSVSSLGQSITEQSETTLRDSTRQDASPSHHSERDNTETEDGQQTELLFLDSFRQLKRSKSIASSLKVRDGYGTGTWYRFSYWATEAWLYEFLAWLISCYCFGGIVITLLTHNGQPIPEWPFDITINALVSAMSTIMSSALLVPVSNAIGQAKWSWIVKRRRKLEDIAVYDEASRGSWGSLVLLMKKGFRDPVAFGAMITILALPIATLLQQTTVVVLEKRPLENSTATLFALNWWAEGLSTESGHPRVKDDMVMSINRGLFFDGNVSDPFLTNALRPRPQCQTGNCSFGTFESLAICSECQDITQSLKMENSTTGLECEGDKAGDYQQDCARWSLPNGHNSGWVNFGSGMLLSTNASAEPIHPRPGLSILTLTALAPCWNYTYTQRNNSYHYKACIGKDEPGSQQQKKTQAQECTLQWCVNRYESEMVNGVLQESIKSTIRSGEPTPGLMYDFSPQNSSVSYWVDLHPIKVSAGTVLGYGNIRSGLIRGKLSVHRQASELVTTYLKSELEGTTSVNDTYVKGGKPYIRRLYMAHLGKYEGTNVPRGFDMDPLFGTMALSMTSSLRTTPAGSQAQPAGDDGNATSDDYEPDEDSWDFPTHWQNISTAPDRLVPVLSVRWGWVALPAALELLTFFLLCYMVGWKSQRSLPVWKSSTLPLLLLGSEMHDGSGDNIPRHLVDMEQLAKEATIEPEIAMGRGHGPANKNLEDGWNSEATRSWNRKYSVGHSTTEVDI
ncbi:hypothetical protein PG997_013591 [Apiospora hydei]|uniref:Uncharacterized protein n=1 Tax=Apiospora hydei TaxID=1337664 RepID=A0ABR1V9W6_9PEZI